MLLVFIHSRTSEDVQLVFDGAWLHRDFLDSVIMVGLPFIAFSQFEISVTLNSSKGLDQCSTLSCLTSASVSTSVSFVRSF